MNESDAARTKRIRRAMRNSREARGYGAAHRQRRRVLKPFVESGAAVCVRCSEPILPGEPWDLGHDDYDRSVWTGPEHMRCNRATERLRLSRQW